MLLGNRTQYVLVFLLEETPRATESFDLVANLRHPTSVFLKYYKQSGIKTAVGYTGGNAEDPSYVSPVPFIDALRRTLGRSPVSPILFPPTWSFSEPPESPKLTQSYIHSPLKRLVCSGSTGHAEALNIQFDPSKVTYAELVA